MQRICNGDRSVLCSLKVSSVSFPRFLSGDAGRGGSPKNIDVLVRIISVLNNVLLDFCCCWVWRGRATYFSIPALYMTGNPELRQGDVFVRAGLAAVIGGRNVQAGLAALEASGVLPGMQSLDISVCSSRSHITFRRLFMTAYNGRDGCHGAKPRRWTRGLGLS